MRAHGVNAIAPAQATEMLGLLLQRDIAQIGFMHIDWQCFSATESSSSPSRFSEVVVASRGEMTGVGQNLRALILSVPAAENVGLIGMHVGQTVASLLRTNVAKLDSKRPLKEMDLDSLMAFELLNRLEAQFSISLSTSMISPNSSIDSLDAIVLSSYGSSIDKSGNTNDNTQLIGRAEDSPIESASRSEQALTLRFGGSGAPLFLIHPAGGATSIYHELAAQLPEGFPVYAIQSRMSAGQGDEWTSIEEMAHNYAEIIVRRQPSGALRLAGFSAGGVFGWQRQANWRGWAEMLHWSA